MLGLYYPTQGRFAGLRVPLASYLEGRPVSVYSLVATIPFSPLDVDLSRLSRGEWNPETDRFRIWYMPSEAAGDGQPVCYVMVRKFDQKDGVVVYAHFVINMSDKSDGKQKLFTVGVLSNDDVRARSLVNSLLEIPPSFHRRSEVKLIEKKWRSDPDPKLRFVANLQSALVGAQPNPSGIVYKTKLEPPSDMMRRIARGMESWWSQTT